MSESARPGGPVPVAVMHTARILVVDDDDSVREAVARNLMRSGYEVHTADCGVAALAKLDTMRFDLMLSDVRMPGMSGVGVAARAIGMDPDLAVIMLSAVDDATTATDAFAGGAMDYLVKPVELVQLRRAVERVLHRRSLEVERKRVEREIREEMAEQTMALEREQRALRELSIAVVDTLVHVMEAKDIYLSGHSLRTAELAAAVAGRLGLDDDTIEHVRLAGRLHDVGKVGIREEVLNIPGRLTAEQMAHVQEHVRIGVEILTPLAHLGPTLRFVASHHEHWDGSGYPGGLAGEAIPIGARILCVVDAYDALTSRRPWREPLTQDATLAQLASKVGTMFDPAVEAALRQIVLSKQVLVFLDDPGHR